MTNAIVEVRDISKCYGGATRAGSRGHSKHHKHTESMTRALDHVTFTVAPGEFVAIMGPSGSGKSTLLNCLATIDVPTNGSVIIGGKNVVGMSSREVARFRREQLGFIFQDSNLLDTLTIRENIALALTLTHVPSSEVVPRVNALAQQLGIAETLNRYPYEVSGGQKQRVAAARAVITKPHLVLADEPTGALDTRSARDLMGTLEFLHKGGTTILMVTHDAKVASYCDRVLFIRDGKLWGQMGKRDDERKEFYSRIVVTAAQLEEGEFGDA
ncbi:MAG: ABC transporter ATP-binding protein [Eggerthellaceae bacterium]